MLSRARAREQRAAACMCGTVSSTDSAHSPSTMTSDHATIGLAGLFLDRCFTLSGPKDAG